MSPWPPEICIDLQRTVGVRVGAIGGGVLRGAVGTVVEPFPFPTDVGGLAGFAVLVVIGAAVRATIGAGVGATGTGVEPFPTGFGLLVGFGAIVTTGAGVGATGAGVALRFFQLFKLRA